MYICIVDFRVLLSKRLHPFLSTTIHPKTSNKEHGFPTKYLNDLHHNFLFLVLWTCLATSIKKDEACKK